MWSSAKLVSTKSVNTSSITATNYILQIKMDNVVRRAHRVNSLRFRTACPCQTKACVPITEASRIMKIINGVGLTTLT